MQRFRRHWAGLLCVCLWTVALTCGAQEGGDDTTRARQQFQAGVNDYDAGRYSDALGHFQEAYRIKPHPLVRVNIANCYEKLDRPLDAIENFEAFLRANDGSAAQRDEVRLALKELLNRVGTLKFEVEPEGARILIDERDERRAPVTEPVHVGTGRHRVTVALEGYETALRVIDVKAGENERVRVELTRVPGSEVVARTPPAEAAPDTDEIPPDIEPPATAPPPIPMRADASQPSESVLSTGVWLAGGATVLLAVSAVVTGQLALAADREFDGYLAAVRNPQLTEFQRAGAWSRGIEASNRANALAIATDVLIGLSLVGAGATVYLYLSERQDRRGVSASLGPGRLQLQGRF